MVCDDNVRGGCAVRIYGLPVQQRSFADAGGVLSAGCGKPGFVGLLFRADAGHASVVERRLSAGSAVYLDLGRVVPGLRDASGFAGLGERLSAKALLLALCGPGLERTVFLLHVVELRGFASVSVLAVFCNAKTEVCV